MLYSPILSEWSKKCSQYPPSKPRTRSESALVMNELGLLRTNVLTEGSRLDHRKRHRMLNPLRYVLFNKTNCIGVCKEAILAYEVRCLLGRRSLPISAHCICTRFAGLDSGRSTILIFDPRSASFALKSLIAHWSTGGKYIVPSAAHSSHYLSHNYSRCHNPLARLCAAPESSHELCN